MAGLEVCMCAFNPNAMGTEFSCVTEKVDLAILNVELDTTVTQD